MKTLLIIDDNIDHLIQLAGLFNSMDYQVIARTMSEISILASGIFFNAVLLSKQIAAAEPEVLACLIRTMPSTPVFILDAGV